MNPLKTLSKFLGMEKSKQTISSRPLPTDQISPSVPAEQWISLDRNMGIPFWRRQSQSIGISRQGIDLTKLQQVSQEVQLQIQGYDVRGDSHNGSASDFDSEGVGSIPPSSSIPRSRIELIPRVVIKKSHDPYISTTYYHIFARLQVNDVDIVDVNAQFSISDYLRFSQPHSYTEQIHRALREMEQKYLEFFNDPFQEIVFDWSNITFEE